MLSSLRDTSPPVGYFRGTDSFCRMTFSHDCLDWFGRGGLMCAHPVSEAVSCFMPEPESRARASPASGRRNTAVAYTDSMMLHWTVRYGTVIGNSSLSGRAFSVWVVAAGDKRSDRSDGFGGTPVLCVSGVWCPQNDWLELDDGVACCGTHTTPTNNQSVQRCRPRGMQVRVPAPSECAAWGSDLSRRVCMV